jgi:hypothetical protein
MGNGYSAPPVWLEKVREIFRGHMQTTYCPVWDHYVRVAITLGMVKHGYHNHDHKTSLPEYYVCVGDYRVWIKNYPDTFGFVIDGSNRRKDRPSFATMRLLRKEVKRVLLEAQRENLNV